MDGPLRFSEIAQAVPELSDRLLSERMKELEARGIVERTVHPGPPLRVEYELSRDGPRARAGALRAPALGQPLARRAPVAAGAGPLSAVVARPLNPTTERRRAHRPPCRQLSVERAGAASRDRSPVLSRASRPPRDSVRFTSRACRCVAGEDDEAIQATAPSAAHRDRTDRQEPLRPGRATHRRRRAQLPAVGEPAHDHLVVAGVDPAALQGIADELAGDDDEPDSPAPMQFPALPSR